MKFYTVLIVLFFLKTTFSQTLENKLYELSDDYPKFGLSTTNIPEKWEDGIRTGGAKGTYEWWYFDAHLEDSSTVVIVFYTKPFINIKKGLKPCISIEIVRPNGTTINKRYSGFKDNFFASKDSCNVQIGKNYFRGNLKEYEIFFEDKDLSLSAKITRTTESWRPKTGHILFGADRDKYFAWVVPVPNGNTEINLNYKGNRTTLTGSCYHDHNWGNTDLTKLINHWYWSRAKIGPYNIIASEMIATKEFDSEPIIVFNLSENGKTIADEGDYVTFYRTYGKLHKKLKKDVSDNLVFIYKTPDNKYRYEYYLYRENSIFEADLLSTAISNRFVLFLAQTLSSFNGAYFRMTGTSEIKVYKNNQLIENHTSPTAIWELMYFGKPYK